MTDKPLVVEGVVALGTCMSLLRGRDGRLAGKQDRYLIFGRHWPGILITEVMSLEADCL